MAAIPFFNVTEASMLLSTSDAYKTSKVMLVKNDSIMHDLDGSHQRCSLIISCQFSEFFVSCVGAYGYEHVVEISKLESIPSTFTFTNKPSPPCLLLKGNITVMLAVDEHQWPCHWVSVIRLR